MGIVDYWDVGDKRDINMILGFLVWVIVCIDSDMLNNIENLGGEIYF